MKEQIQIDATIREGKGRDTAQGLSDLRARDGIPGVIYGGKEPPIKVALSVRALREARKRGGVNAILHLKLGGNVETVMVKTIQHHPVTDKPIHADFKRISLTEKIEAKVPLAVVGEAPGVKTEEGMLQHELRTLTVKALPGDIPQGIELDISGLHMNDRILVKDIKVPQGVEVLDSPEHVVVHVTMVKVEVVETPAADGVVADEVAEPEVIKKGKKDEEGEEGEAAADGKKPEKGAAAKTAPAEKPEKGAGKAAPAKPDKKG